MKSLILTISQKFPFLGKVAFEKEYIMLHPHSDSLSAENIRQAYQTYQASCRKIDRAAKGIKRDPNCPR